MKICYKKIILGLLALFILCFISIYFFLHVKRYYKYVSIIVAMRAFDTAKDYQDMVLNFHNQAKRCPELYKVLNNSYVKLVEILPSNTDSSCLIIATISDGKDISDSLKGKLVIFSVNLSNRDQSIGHCYTNINKDLLDVKLSRGPSYHNPFTILDCKTEIPIDLRK